VPNEKLPVFCRDQLLGYVVNPKVDNFDLYGAWQPEAKGPMSDVLEELDRTGVVELNIGSSKPPMRGTLETVPDSEIEIKIRNA
jgi:hypothetical protein